MFKHKDVVTVELDENNKASNTYIVEGHLALLPDEESNDAGGGISDAVVLKHPLHPEVFIIKQTSQLNKVMAQLKDSTERSLEFTLKFDKHLDFGQKAELESLRLYFVVHRSLPDNLKHRLSGICGTIAAIYFHNDIALAMRYVSENNAVLDDYNRMWFINFKDIFTGRKPIVSPKQRATVFNIAGFVLAELESQQTKK